MPDPLGTPDPPSDIVAERTTRRSRVRTADGRIRTVRLYDLYSVDDVVINMTKAYLYGLVRQTGYDRPETPARLKKTLTRVGLVF